MPDLSTTYLGLKLKNPLVVSASPLSKQIDSVQRLAAAGAAAVVLYSLFEEQITHGHRSLDHYTTRSNDGYGSALRYAFDHTGTDIDPDSYLEHLYRVKQAIDIPVIGSINGSTAGEWIEYARKIQQAGADALELNIYHIPTNMAISGAELEENYLRLMKLIRAQVRIPIALKLNPFFTSLPYIARRFVAAGADGLVLFNRFYQPDFDIDILEEVPNLELSTSANLRLPLRWISFLYGRIGADLALTGGVHTSRDVIKAIMAGANVTMLASEIVTNGIDRVHEILVDIERWLGEHQHTSIAQMRGCMSQSAPTVPRASQRASYIQVLNSLDDHL